MRTIRLVVCTLAIVVMAISVSTTPGCSSGGPQQQSAKQLAARFHNALERWNGMLAEAQKVANEQAASPDPTIAMQGRRDSSQIAGILHYTTAAAAAFDAASGDPRKQGEAIAALQAQFKGSPWWTGAIVIVLADIADQLQAQTLIAPPTMKEVQPATPVPPAAPAARPGPVG